MLDYKQAGEIRRKYPEHLSRENIDSIINEWGKEGIDNIDMLMFSSMFEVGSCELNISEIELFLRGNAHFNFKYLTLLDNRKYYGLLAVMYFENLTEYRNPHEVEKETYNLRLNIGREFLDKCKELDALELSDALKRMRDMREASRKKYKYTKSRWESKVDKLVKNYIIE